MELPIDLLIQTRHFDDVTGTVHVHYIYANCDKMYLLAVRQCTEICVYDVYLVAMELY